MEIIGASEAVQLLIERAAQHGVPLVWDQQNASIAGRICRWLDGIPLAIELAAARLRVMSMTGLHARLGQRFSLLTGGARTALPRSARLHGAAGQALAELGETLEPLERGLRDRDGQRLRSVMGDEAFDAEYRTGTSLTTDEVLALALGSQA